MIKHMRIDNRLIHGQVAAVWSNYISADAIVVCNDKVAADPIQKMALPLAARGHKILVMTIAELVEYNNTNPSETLFVIAKFPTDALEILEQIEKVEFVNVGNAAPITGTEYKMVTKSIAATKEDAVVYRQIAQKLGGKLTTRMVPNNDEEDFLKLLTKAGF